MSERLLEYGEVVILLERTGSFSECITQKERDVVIARFMKEQKKSLKEGTLMKEYETEKPRIKNPAKVLGWIVIILIVALVSYIITL